MTRFIEAIDPSQAVMFPARLDDYVDEVNPVREVDLFVDALDLATLLLSSIFDLANAPQRSEKLPCKLLMTCRVGKPFRIERIVRNLRRELALHLWRASDASGRRDPSIS